MRSLIDRAYFFVLICANANTLGWLFGGHATARAGSAASAVSSGNSEPILLAINVVIIFATFFLGFPKIPRIAAMLSQLRFLAALYLFALISIFWSADRVTTFRSGIYLCVYLVSSIYISLRFPNEGIVRFIGSSMTVLALASVPAQYLLPHDQFLEGNWSGIFQQKNELGVAMAVGVVALLASKRRWNLFTIGSTSLCAGLLLVSRSTTAILACAVAVIAIIYLHLRKQMRLLFVTAILGAVVAAFIAVPDISTLFSDATGKDLTFTGRTAVWALVLKRIEARPFQGYGYNAFWSGEGDAVNQFLNWKPGQAHNGYVEITAEIGLAGLILFLFVVGDGLMRARRLWFAHSHPAGVSLMLAILLLLVHNFAESDFLLPHLAWFVFLVSYLSARSVENTLLAEILSDGHFLGPEQPDFQDAVLHGVIET
jgi:exopolysaccharide production protein ExoQ